MSIGPNGLTRAWRGPKNERKLTVREGAEFGPTFTIFLSSDWKPEFFYMSCGVRGHWGRWHWLKKAA